MKKPSIKFIKDFYFGQQTPVEGFAKSPNFDAAYLQQQCDKIANSNLEYEFGKTSQYWNESEKTEFARRVKAIYK